MTKFIAVCGINCEGCNARLATIANDDVLRAKTVEEWKTQFGIPEMPISAINCTGCRVEGVKFAHCAECEIRNCAIGKGFETCGDCGELGSCSIVGGVIQFLPEAMNNLQS